MLEAEKNDSEATYRALVALGNTVRRSRHCLIFTLHPQHVFTHACGSWVPIAQVYAAKQHSVPLDSAQVSSVRRVLGDLPVAFPEDRIRKMAGAINGML